MDKAIAVKWSAALRSGKYLQGKHRLKTVGEEPPRYCCLGVLCDISGLGRWTDKGAYVTGDDTDGDIHFVPLEVSKVTRLANNGRVEGVISLINMNDTSSLTFADIANVIDKHWERM